MSMYKLLAVLVISFSVTFTYFYLRPVWVPLYQKVAGKQTVATVISNYGADSEKRLVPYFEAAGVQYPPKNITLLAIKQTKQLELWANDGINEKYIRTYPILAASGHIGPKLKEGDRQVPEGIYSLEYLNPNSAFHLSMKLNYPNEFDLKNARAEGRTEPGTNIFIHGKAVSVGCLAMGDDAIEELFVLTSKIGKDAVQIAITPSDPRNQNIMPLATNQAIWVSELYKEITRFFDNFRNEN